MDVRNEQHLHNRMTEVIQRLRKLDMRLSRVTTSICGPVPETAGENPKPIDEHLHDKLDVACRILLSLEEELLRLENSVGTHQSQAAKTATGAAAGY